MFKNLLCIYTKLIVLSLLEIDTLKSTMHIFMVSTCSLKTYVIRLHNLILNEHFLHLKRSQVFFLIVKKNLNTNKLKKPFKNSDIFKSKFNKYFIHKKG